MAGNYEQPGEVIDHAPAANVAAGSAIVIGARIGVAETNTPAGVEGSFAVEGVYGLPKTNGALGQGAEVYLTDAGTITATAEGNTRAGYAFRAAAATASLVSVKLNG